MLHYACCENFDAVIDILIGFGASPNAPLNVPKTQRKSPLMQMIYQANKTDKNLDKIMANTIKSHCESCKKHNIIFKIDESDCYKETLLHFCAFNGFLNCVKALVESGANIYAVNSTDQTPLFYAKKSKKK